MTVTISKKLQVLDDFLSSEAVDDEAMLLSELGGFLAGVIVCPDLIPPSEWLPMIWGDEEPVFDSPKHAQHIIDLIMWHYNDISRQLDRGMFRPIYDFDRDDTPFWEFWIDGFRQAMSLRLDTWAALAENEDADLRDALSIIMRLAVLAGEQKVEPTKIDEMLRDHAPDLIPIYVEVLHRTRHAQADASFAPANQNNPKVGRNEPCPCGSGKKYKKCCLRR